jgi:hypothetical protein
VAGKSKISNKVTMALLDFLGKAAGKAGGGVIESIGNVVDKFVTTDKEREEVKQEMVKIIADYEITTQQEVTKRLQADMSSDSWLSKNIRPMVMIFILFLYSLFSVLDGNVGRFRINPGYIELLGQWGMLIMSFYYGSRGLEKIFTIVNQKNKQ